MNASPLLLAGSLEGVVADRLAAGPRPVSAFRRLLDEVWTRDEPRLAKFAIGMGLTRHDAADALQDVYVTTLQRPPAIDAEAELVRWLFRVTANRCRLEHRQRGRRRRHWLSLTNIWNGNHLVASESSYGELKQEIARALAALGDDDRTLVVMRYFCDLNSREIAEALNMSEATVRGRLRAARRELADQLVDWNDGC